MSVLADYLRGESAHLRAETEARKAAKLDWQRAVRELVDQIRSWLQEADRDEVLRVEICDRAIEDYDFGVLHLTGLSIGLRRTIVRLTPQGVEPVGVILLPGETTRRRFDGVVEFDNGIDRIPLYRVKVGSQDVWLWWTHGGIGQPFDRESFEGVMVGLLR